MFWKFDVHTTSQVDTLLEKEDVTLMELLDEDDILQECKAQNKKLIDFLIRTEVMDELISYITKEPSGELEEQLQYKHPNMACELLTSEVGAISDKLAETESAMNALWSFLDHEPPLNPLLASFFSKTIGSLLVRRPEVVIDHLKSKDNSISILLNHLGTSAIMDLLLRLITCIESREVRQEFLEWLNEQKFIQRLVDLIDPEETDDKHSNAAQTLCDIVRITREHMSQLQECAESDPLLTTLEKQETVAELLEHMFHGKKSKSALVNGVCVLLALLEFKKQGMVLSFFRPEGQEQMTALDAERLAHGVSGTLKAIVPQLPELHQLLTDPPEQDPMPTTVGQLSPPFGAVRLQVCKLIAALLVTNTQSINVELARLGTIKSIWELLFQYAWNNFLHLEVEKCISTILANNPTESEEGKTQHPLLVHLFTDCKLIQRILESWEENEQTQQKGGSRRGYMGHLTRITNTVIHEMEKGCNCDQIKSLFQEYVPEDYRDKWTSFVVGSLSELNKRNTVDLVGTHPLHSSSEDDDGDFGNIDFGKDTAVQQMQQMTSHFIDQFGFSDEDFTKQEENVNNPFDTISDISFSISANEDNPNSALFEACCNERISKFNDNNSDEEDMWEEKELTFLSSVDESRTCDSTAGLGAASDDSDSEDEHTKEAMAGSPQPSPSNSEETKMDVDSADTWTANFDDVPMDGSVAMDTTPTTWPDSPPQARSSQAGEPETGWANFDDFNAGFNSSSPEGPRSSSPIAMDSESSQDDISGQEATSNEATPLYPAQPGAAYVVSSNPEQEKHPEDSNRSTQVTSIGTSTQSEHSVPEDRDMVVELCSQSGNSSFSQDTVTSLHNSYPAFPLSPQPAAPQPDSTVVDPQMEPLSPGQSLLNSEIQAKNLHEMSSSSDSINSNQLMQQEVKPPPQLEAQSGAPNSLDGSGLSQPQKQEADSHSAQEGAAEVSSEETIAKQRNTVDDVQQPVSTVIEVVDGNCSQPQDEDEEDLEDNFSFLASSGLMKGGPGLSPKPNGPSESERLEKARAEATAALNQFTAATKQNGPV
ncbi:serine/threonine-protein phosphatase 6 regulatory subunit 3-like isoform X2 [Acanthaster planci]|uniref:Serine/threonine-protein phosphatase 6 regulatory subunit 3-like isoform X2 n=1 Tax=Acanthaster planci TaxID=133434 RepID=A0A8B7Z8G2_ACAPL|nr:serine/threonine-protein phosphatase 6 regulatory subunit 3-like isoform X2 [Acanthaster planci]